MIGAEKLLVDALKKAKVDVIRGGEKHPKMDQIAWNTKLVQEHIRHIAEAKPETLIINQGGWTFPWDSVDAVKRYAAETEDVPRVVMFSHKDPTVPGLVAAWRGWGINAHRRPFSHVLRRHQVR